MNARRIELAVVAASMALMGLVPVAMSNAFGTVTVTPDGGSLGNLLGETAGHQVTFTVAWDGDEFEGAEEFDLSCNGSKITSCSVASSVGPIWPGFDDDVTVTFTTSATTGSGVIYLHATGQTTSEYDSGHRTFTVIDPIEVTANSVPSSVVQYAEDDTATFDVKNNYRTSKTFTFTCEWGGGSCPHPSSESIGAGQTETIDVVFDAGAVPTTHDLKLTASTGGVSRSDTESVTVGNYTSVTVKPVRRQVYSAPSGWDSASFVVRAPGQSASTFTFGVQCSGSINCSGVSSTSIGDAPDTIDVPFYSGSNGDTASITLTATKSGEPSVTSSASLEAISTNQILISVDDANHGLGLVTK